MKEKGKGITQCKHTFEATKEKQFAIAALSLQSKLIEQPYAFFIKYKNFVQYCLKQKAVKQRESGRQENRRKKSYKKKVSLLIFVYIFWIKYLCFPYFFYPYDSSRLFFLFLH